LKGVKRITMSLRAMPRHCALSRTIMRICLWLSC
jgi:hypothetical protein